MSIGISPQALEEAGYKPSPELTLRQQIIDLIEKNIIHDHYNDGHCSIQTVCLPTLWTEYDKKKTGFLLQLENILNHQFKLERKPCQSSYVLKEQSLTLECVSSKHQQTQASSAPQ